MADDRALANVSKQLDQVIAAVTLLRERHEATLRAFNGEIVRAQMGIDALLRRAFFEGLDPDYPEKLTAQRFRSLSQNGEDGMILAIFREIGVATRRFVDIGCGYNGGNSGVLARELGWSGLMVDAEEDRVDHMRTRFPPQRVRVAQAWVIRDRFNDFLAEHGMTGEVDLMSIDIDGNDFWLWEELQVCQPRLVIIEYNANFGGERAVVVPYAEDFDRKAVHATYFGASLGALAQLAKRKGYRLIGVEPQGINAFFLRDDVGEWIPGVPAAEAYRPKLKTKQEYGGTRMKGDPVTRLFDRIERDGLPLVEIE